MPKPKKQINFQFAIHIAEGFYQTGKSLAINSKNDNSNHGYIWVPPGVVNFSFATELILKATIFYDSGVNAWGHNLYKLYLTLKNETRTSIEDSYKKNKIENDLKKDLPSFKLVICKADSNEDHSQETNLEEIKNLLELHSESFENWRYIHEFGKEGYSYEFNFNAMDAFYLALKAQLQLLLSKRNQTFGMKKV